MADDLLLKCSQLVITKEKDDIVDLGGEPTGGVDERAVLSLVGKVLSEGPYNLVAMKNTLNQVGLLLRDCKIFSLCSSFTRKIKRAFLNGILWCFVNNLVLLEEWDSSLQPSDTVLNSSPFWVRGVEFTV